jgi:hypothetical protein
MARPKQKIGFEAHSEPASDEDEPDWATLLDNERRKNWLMQEGVFQMTRGLLKVFAALRAFSPGPPPESERGP